MQERGGGPFLRRLVAARGSCTRQPVEVYAIVRPVSKVAGRGSTTERSWSIQVRRRSASRPAARRGIDWPCATWPRAGDAHIWAPCACGAARCELSIGLAGPRALCYGRHPGCRLHATPARSHTLGRRPGRGHPAVRRRHGHHSQSSLCTTRPTAATRLHPSSTAAEPLLQSAGAC